MEKLSHKHEQTPAFCLQRIKVIWIEEYPNTNRDKAERAV